MAIGLSQIFAETIFWCKWRRIEQHPRPRSSASQSMAQMPRLQE